MTSLSFKASYKNTKRRFSVESSTSFDEFQARLASMFSRSPPLTITYEDDENDIVSVSSDAELTELFSIASTAKISPLRLHIYDSEEEVPDAAPEPMEETPRAAPHSQPDPVAPQIETVISGVGQILASIFGEGIPPPSTPPFRGSRRGRCGWGGRHRGHRHNRGPGFGRGPYPGFRQGPSPFGPMDGFFSVLSPFLASFGGAENRDGMDFSSRIQNVSQETRTAFRELAAALMAVDNRAAVMTSARNAFPVVRDWMRNNLGESGAVDSGAVNTLVSSIQNAVGTVLGTEMTGRLTRLVRVAMGDSAVVDMLRQLPDDMPFEWEAELHMPMGREAEGAGGFSVHRQVECDNCGTSPIVGSRFKATNRLNYDLCSTCYNSDSVNKEDLQFKECKFVWEAELEDAVVPPAPISMGDRGPRVAFLQKILTDLGYMNERAYRRAVGMFGPNTRMAVLQFQREYGLTEVSEEGVYDATTAASLTSVLELQVPPTAAAGGDTTGAGPSSATAEGTPKTSAAQG